MPPRSERQTRVIALRAYRPDDDLGCDRSYVYGYRPVCRCGWRGSRQHSHDLAAAELHWHQQDQHGGRID